MTTTTMKENVQEINASSEDNVFRITSSFRHRKAAAAMELYNHYINDDDDDDDGKTATKHQHCKRRWNSIWRHVLFLRDVENQRQPQDDEDEDNAEEGYQSSPSLSSSHGRKCSFSFLSLRRRNQRKQQLKQKQNGKEAVLDETEHESLSSSESGGEQQQQSSMALMMVDSTSNTRSSRSSTNDCFFKDLTLEFFATVNYLPMIREDHVENWTF